MKTHCQPGIRWLEVELPCRELEETVEFFTANLQFQLHSIFPADDPSVAVISGHGVKLRLNKEGTGGSGTLRLLCDDPGSLALGVTRLKAPNGTRIELVKADPPLTLPPLKEEFVLTRMKKDQGWHPGRAGMQYRDLIPGRLGGRFIASHIRILQGGPVHDYVHFHRIRFQLIYCFRGWVKVLYEDQGPSITMQEGDCVLQPPGIRHRVVECSPGMEVIEIGSPARHETFADPDLELPNEDSITNRDFGDQRFVFHQAAQAERVSCPHEGFECVETGIGEATAGMVGVRILEHLKKDNIGLLCHQGEFSFLFVLEGKMNLARADQGSHLMNETDCCVLPSGESPAISECSDALKLLEVTLPAS